MDAEGEGKQYAPAQQADGGERGEHGDGGSDVGALGLLARVGGRVEGVEGVLRHEEANEHCVRLGERTEKGERNGWSERGKEGGARGRMRKQVVGQIRLKEFMT